jgi:hypothetical protein
MREVAGSTPGLDFYLLCEPICVSLSWLDYIKYNFDIDVRGSQIYIKGSNIKGSEFVAFINKFERTLPIARFHGQNYGSDH